MKRRTLLLTLPWAAPLLAEPARRGAAVAWPEGVRLVDGSAWQVRTGHAVVVVFWSLDCSYCERHNAHVEKLHRAAAGKPLQVLGVVRGGDEAAVQRRMRARGWSFAVTLAAGPLSEALTARRSVPMTVTVDRQGRLCEQIPGEMFEADVLDLLKLAS